MSRGRPVPKPGRRSAAPQAENDADEAVAIAALGFLAADESRLERFFALSGLDPESLRAAAREPHFLVGVLDHVVSNEALLLAFADESGIAASAVTQAHARLAGRDRIWDSI